jgi:hypothetical protein
MIMEPQSYPLIAIDQDRGTKYYVIGWTRAERGLSPVLVEVDQPVESASFAPRGSKYVFKVGP